VIDSERFVESRTPASRISGKRIRRAIGRRALLSIGGAGLAISLILVDPLSAAAATHTYKNSSLGLDVWASDSSRSSQSNSAEPQVVPSMVEVSNGVFTATGQGYVKQTYAKATHTDKCRWTTPEHVTWTQTITCIETL
jgi:hypothetical protein